MKTNATLAAGFLLVTVSCFRERQNSVSEDLKGYAKCSFSDALGAVQVDALRPGISIRTVQTNSGPKQVEMLGGVRIMLAYPNTDFFANVKVEKLPADIYPQLKESLAENLSYMGSSVSARPTVGNSNGLEMRGVDRERLDGGVIGTYLLFDNKRQLAITIYILNQEPAHRKFQTVGDYRQLRDRFLETFSACVASRP